MIERLHRWLFVLALLLPVVGWAAEIDISAQQIAAGEDGYVLSADFNFELNQRLEETVTKGVVLYFVADFELSRPRWYWLDEKMVSRSQTYRLSYHALTRQYRLSTGALHQSFATLTEALRMLAHLRNWVVVDKSDKSVRSGEPYLAALRLRLDITQLPRPFQMTALGNKEWSLTSDWKTWPVSLPPAQPVEAK